MIRQATPLDLPALIEMGRAFHAEADKTEMGAFCVQSFTEFLDRVTGNGFLIVAVKDDKPIGMLGLMGAPAWWNKAVLTGQEVFWYVDPSHRKGVGRDLFDAFEKAAILGGIQVQFVALEKGRRERALGHFYEQRGYRAVETIYAKRMA